MKKIISLFLALTMCFILCIPTLAYEQAENAAIGIDEFISIYLLIFSLSIVVKIVVNTSMQLDAEPLILRYLWTHERTSSL